MRTEDKSGYGMRNGKLTHVSDTPRGRACGCVCVVCGKSLVARKGSKRRHHFAHAADIECQGAAETILHLLSKELLGELEYINIPPYEFIQERKTKTKLVVKHQEQVAKGGKVVITGTRIESHEIGFIPDVILNCGTKDLILEIAVTHKVDRAKMRHIRRRNLPAIEIRLDYCDALLSRDELRNKLQKDLLSKFWLFHPGQREAERAFFAKFRQFIKDKRKIQRVSIASLPTQRQFMNTLPISQPSLNEQEKLADAFYKKYKYYPSMEECLRLWPQHWKKP